MRLSKLAVCVLFSTLGILAVVSTACSGSGVETYQIPKTQPKASPSMGHPPTPASRPASELTWTAPEGWVAKKGTTMRLANFQVPGGGDGSECYLMILGGAGGGTVPNINRWRRQIGLPELDEATILAQTTEHSGNLGVFQAVRLENPAQPNTALLAAILPLEGSTAFVKLNAPIDRMDAVEGDFLKFAASVALASGQAPSGG